MKLREWNAHLHGLVVFRALLNDPVVAKLLDLTDQMCIRDSEWVALDLKYIQERSFWVDWKIIFLTVRAMFMKYGE